MKIAILTCDGFNELDSFIAYGILNRVKMPGWKAEITSPSDSVVSMNGLKVQAEQPLSFAKKADVVIFGSGIRTLEQSQSRALMSEFQFDLKKQLVGSQCSGAIFLQSLGLLDEVPACADDKTKPILEKLGCQVLEQPFFASGNVFTSGGCLSSHYLAAWVIAKFAGLDEAVSIIRAIAPIGEKENYEKKVREAIDAFL